MSSAEIIRDLQQKAIKMNGLDKIGDEGGYIAGEHINPNQTYPNSEKDSEMTTTIPAEKATTQIFDFEGQNVRTVQIDSEPWFVLADVCKALDITNSGNAKRRLDDADKGIRAVDTPGGKQQLTVINESGLYDVILDSRKPQAKKFRRWITSEVIPAIRKHGGYVTEAKIEEILLNPEAGIQMLQALKDEQDKRKSLEAEKAVLEPKAERFDEWMNAKDAILLGNAAKVLDQGRNIIGQNRLFKFLREQGILSTGGQRHNVPKQQFHKHFKVKTNLYSDVSGRDHVNMTTYVKPSGMAWIAELLRAEGYPI